MKLNKHLSALLIAAMLFGTAACSSGESPEGGQTAQTGTAAATETETADPGRAGVKDNLPADLNYNGRTVLFMCENGGVGPSETNGDILNDAKYEALARMQDRLNVKYEYVNSSANWKDYSALLEAGVQAGGEGWDIVVTKSNSAIQMKRDFLFTDIRDNKYIDLDQPWWWKNAMMDFCLDGHTLRFLVGDITTSHVEQAGAAFFNKKLFRDTFGDPDELYKLVVDRKWTWDKAIEYTKGAYKDVNGNGKADSGDIFGCVNDNAEYLRHVQFTCGVRMYSRGADGIPYVDYDVERAVKAIDKLNEFYYNTPGNVYDASGAVTAQQIFIGGEMLLYQARLGTAVRFRDMEDDFGIIPHPMLDEAQGEYTNAVSNSSYFSTIPVTAKDPDLSGAVLEANCAEAYRSVIEVFYDTVLKMKYSRDEYSGQCIDIIHDVTRNNLFNEYNSIGAAMLILNEVKAGTNNFASQYAAIKDVANQRILELIDLYSKK